jgi:phosphoenolpyruvate phosphomutase
MKKTTQLKEMINSKSLEFIMEAHNGLSAKIVEEAGFKGIWGSGLSLSAALGVRDNNEASWTQIIDVVEFMSDATTIPILLDGDTGYGNFNNMRRLVKKLEQRDIAGVCIEDKLFPKTNSFIQGEAQPLADMDEFCGKIKAAKDTQRDDDFCVVARIEAFIAGWGLEEALKRAEAYRLAGADAIFVHSKKSNSSDIEAFMHEWEGRHPIIIVPTTYYSTPTEKFRELGISLSIWANHNLRASIDAMQRTSAQIMKDQSLINVEDPIVPVKEIFRIQGAGELQEAEKIYLPSSGKTTNGIILAAGQGDLGELTRSTPKCMLKVHGKPIITHQVNELNKMGIKDVCVVRGFEKEKVSLTNISTRDNDNYTNTKALASLKLALDKIVGDTIISYGDILYKSYVLHDLMNSDDDITITVDADTERVGTLKDFVIADKKYQETLLGKTAFLKKMGSDLLSKSTCGEFIGLMKVSEEGAKKVKKAIEVLEKDSGFNDMDLTALFNYLIEKDKVAIKYIKGSWLDIDTVIDLQSAGDLYA